MESVQREVTSSANGSLQDSATRPWGESTSARLSLTDPIQAGQCFEIPDGPWFGGILPQKDVALIGIAVNAACAKLSADETRRQMRGALEAGATREEILMVLKLASLLSIHSCSHSASIVLEEAAAAGVRPGPKESVATPVCDRMKATGQWNGGWGAFYEIDPAWTEAILAANLPAHAGATVSPRLAALLGIAVDASITHMYAPGTRRHIQTALKLGTTIEEIMEVLKICVSARMQACNLGAPILADELERLEIHVSDFDC